VRLTDTHISAWVTMRLPKQRHSKDADLQKLVTARSLRHTYCGGAASIQPRERGRHPTDGTRSEPGWVGENPSHGRGRMPLPLSSIPEISSGGHFDSRGASRKDPRNGTDGPFFSNRLRSPDHPSMVRTSEAELRQVLSSYARNECQEQRLGILKACRQFNDGVRGDSICGVD
jgi:hypothetical protein